MTKYSCAIRKTKLFYKLRTIQEIKKNLKYFKISGET